MSWAALKSGAGHPGICAIVKIEGVGHGLSASNLAATDGDGATKFYSQLPLYARQGDFLTDRPYLRDLPDPLGEDVDELGGFPALGEVTFGIVDVGNYLTDRLRTEADPVTWLASSIGAATTVFNVADGSVLSSSTPGNVAFIGAEAVRITGISTNQLTVARAYLLTRAETHDEDAPVFLYPSFMRGRRVQYLWTPYDAASSAEDELIAEGTIDHVWFDEVANVWRFAVRTELTYLERMVPRSSTRRGARIARDIPARAQGTDREGLFLQVEPVGTYAAEAMQIWVGYEEDPDVRWYARAGGPGGEVIGMRRGGRLGELEVSRRQVARTERRELRDGDTLYQVFVAGAGGLPSSFRYSPGPTPATTRGAGTWVQSAHWIDIILCILTSSTHEDDGLELQNYQSAYGNWAVLPPGFGVGLPASKVDWSAALDVKARTVGYDFPGFIFGDEPESFASLISRHFLRPLGAYIVSSAGVAKIILPRIPVGGSAELTLGPAQILTRRVGPGRYEPRIEIERDVSSHTGSIRFERDGQTLLEVDSDDYANTYGRRGLYGTDTAPVSIEVPSVDVGDTRSEAMLRQSGVRRLVRLHRPVFRAQADVTLEFRDELVHGTVVGVTHADAPNLNGTRGWSGLLAELIGREDRLEAGADGGAFLALKLLGYGAGLRVGKVTPAAYVSAVAAVRYGWSFNKPSEYTGGYTTYDEYCALGATAYADLGGANQSYFSVVLVFTIDDLTNPENHYLLCIQSNFTDREFAIRITSAGVLQVMVKGAAKATSAAGAISEGSRYFLVVTYDGTVATSTARIEVWLAEIGVDSSVADPITTNNATGSDLDFDDAGQIYELARREAGPDGYACATYELYGAWLATLSQSDADALYNGGSYIDPDDTGAGAPAGVLHWHSFGGHASDDPASQLTDMLGGGANGTPANMESDDQNPVTASGVVATTANRYTQSDATGGLPTTDAEAFDVGDVVQRAGLDGALAGSATQTVTAVAASGLTLDGDFSGALAAGDIIVAAEWDSMSAAQKLDHAAFGARATNGIDAGGGQLWTYGEP